MLKNVYLCSQLVTQFTYPLSRALTPRRITFMRKILALLLIVLTAATAVGKNPYAMSSNRKGGDKILLRDGNFLDAQIQQITQNSVRFNNLTRGIKLDELPLTDIYLIKSGKRGNLFFTQGGKRKTGDQLEIDPKATVLYTTDYREIPVFTLEFDEDKVIYQTSKADRKNPQPLKKALPQSLLFMIVYPDGTSDIFNDMTKEQTYTPSSATEQSAQPEEPKEELKVVFHNVKQGDTLNSLAERYAVTAAEIREWNEIGAKTKDTTPLKPGQQLMLYVKNAN